MVVVLIIGGGLGWFAYRVRVKRMAIAAIKRDGGRIDYDDQFASDKTIPPPPGGRKTSWLERQTGDELFRDVTRVIFYSPPAGKPEARPTAETIAALARLGRLEVLTLRDPTPEATTALGRLGSLSSLYMLALEGPDVTDAALPGVARLRHLKHLNLLKVSVMGSGPGPPGSGMMG